ncbi:MAG: hypothetical protein R3231_04030, partial [bacterium]|nr:hypothetical protein [bacterium]
MKRVLRKCFVSIVLSTLLAGGLFGTAYGAIPAAERAALIALYNTTGGANWTNKGGWKNPPLAADGFGAIGTECTWYGIACVGNGVDEIDLYSNNLIGNLPPELSSLSSLQRLFLHYNQLTGSIPPEVVNTSSL